MQSLPISTANSIMHLLLGALPMKAEIEKKHLGLFYSVITSENSTPQNLWKRENDRLDCSTVEVILSVYLVSLKNITSSAGGFSDRKYGKLEITS